MDESNDGTEATIATLDKRLALLEQAMTNGFENLRQAVQRLEEKLHDFSSGNTTRIERLETRVDDIEPFVLSARATWAIAWKILVGAAVVGVLWAIASSGVLTP